jgi:hypothetical protein
VPKILSSDVVARDLCRHNRQATSCEERMAPEEAVHPLPCSVSVTGCDACLGVRAGYRRTSPHEAGRPATAHGAC